MLLQKSTFSTSSLALLLLLHSAGKINRNAIKLITSMCASKLTYAQIHTHTHIHYGRLPVLTINAQLSKLSHRWPQAVNLSCSRTKGQNNRFLLGCTTDTTVNNVHRRVNND